MTTPKMTTPAVEERTLETIVGPLTKIFPKLKRGTIQHSNQLTKVTKEGDYLYLRNQWFYLADSSLYTVEEEGGIDEVFLYLGREPTNPIFNNIEEATQKLINTRNYALPKEKRDEIDAVIKAEDTLRVKLSDLSLEGDDNGFRYFKIDTANYDRLNKHQRRVAERVYGQGNNFVEYMKILNEDGIGETGVYVLNPDYVKQNVPQNGALVRACWLVHFGLVSGFIAVGWGVDFHAGLRGVPNVAEGDAPKINYGSIVQTLDTPGFDPSQLGRALNPQAAKTLTDALGTYTSLQKQ